MVDVSKRSSVDDVIRMRTFLKKQIEDLKVSSENVRVGIILLGKSGDEMLTLDEGSDKIKAISFVLGITKGDSDADIYAALQKIATNKLSTTKRNVPQTVVILIKDDDNELGEDRIEREIEKLSNGGNKVISVNFSPDNEAGVDNNKTAHNIKGTRDLANVYSTIYKELAASAGLHIYNDMCCIF